MDGLASYAGVPVTVEGQVIGAVCVLGDVPHEFTADDVTELRTAAAEAEGVLRRYRHD